MTNKWKNILLYGAIALVSAYSTIDPVAAHKYVEASFPGLVFLLSTWMFCQNACKAD